MKNCELCKRVAKTYCESDGAYLCWSCDTHVHAANFLVARHARRLLCGTCQSLTLWSASGPMLGCHTVAICDACAVPRLLRSREPPIQINGPAPTSSSSDSSP